MGVIKRFSDNQGEWDEPVMVKVNGKDYPTQLYNGVQRFVPNDIVEFMVNQVLQAYLHKDTLGADLNSIVIKVLQGELSFEDYIEFSTMYGYSVVGFCDAISNLADNFSGEVEDWFTIENPLWESENN